MRRHRTAPTAAAVGGSVLLALAALSACSSSSGSDSSSSPTASPHSSTANKNGQPACQKKPMKQALMSAGAPIAKISGKPVCSGGWAGAYYILDGNGDKERAMFKAKNGAWTVVPGSDVNAYCQPGDDTVPAAVTAIACVT